MVSHFSRLVKMHSMTISYQDFQHFTLLVFSPTPPLTRMGSRHRSVATLCVLLIAGLQFRLH